MAVALLSFGDVGHALAGPPTGGLKAFAAKRVWSDKSGRFEVEAELADANREQVKLKRADGKVVTVRLAQLSEADRAYVEAFLVAEMAAGGSAPVNPFEVSDETPASSPGAGTSSTATSSAAGMFDLDTRTASDRRTRPISIDTSGAFWSAGPVTPIEAASVDEVSIKLPMKKEFFAKLRMEVAGRTPHILANVYRQGRKEEENYSVFGRLILPDGDPEPLGNSEEPWKLMAFSSDARYAAAVRVVGFDKGSDLAVFQFTSEGAQPLYEFPAGGGAWDELHWVGFLGENRMATISQKHTLTVWNLDGPQALHRGKVEGSLSAAIGGNGELLAVPSAKGVAVFDGKNLKQVGFLPLQGGSAPQIAFSPDGRQLAAYVPFEISVYDLEDGQLSKSISVAESDPNLSLDWIGAELLLGKKLLVDVEKGIPAWTYMSQAASQSVHGDKLYAIFGGDTSSLVSLSLPHEAARRAVEQADASQLYVLQPGSDFAIESRLNGFPSGEQSEIQNAIRAKLEQSGWKYSPASSNKVILELQQGEQQETEYRVAGFHTEKVKYRPWTHSVQFTVGGQEVYRFQRVVGSGFMLSVKQGESAQQAVDRTVKPTASIFQGALLPARILKPALREGLGKSTITASGLK